MLVRVADAAALNPVLRLVREDTPAAVFVHTGAGLLALAAGSTAVLWLRREDLAGLNLGRELFRERSLRVVAVAQADVADALRDDAPDLYDWMTQRLDLTQDPPGWAVDTVRAILSLGVVRISWIGGNAPDATLRAARDWPIARASAQGSWTELRAAAAAPGWRIWEGVRSPWDEARVRYAEALEGAEGAPVLERPALDLPGWWRVHADVAAFEVAPEGDWEAAIEAGFEPEALGLATREEPAWGADVPAEARGVALRLMGPQIRVLEPDVFLQAWREEGARVAEAVTAGGWPVLGCMPTLFDAEIAEGPLADAMYRLSEHAASFLVERAAREGRAPRARVEAMVDARHLDIATEWLPSVPTGVWKDLLTILAREGEAIWTDIAEIEALLGRADGDPGLVAAVRFRLGQARFDAMDLQGARRELRAALAVEISPERSFEIGLLDAQVTDRIGPMIEAQATVGTLADRARKWDDDIREARTRPFLGFCALRAGRRAQLATVLGEVPTLLSRYLVTLLSVLELDVGGNTSLLHPLVHRQGRLGRVAAARLNGALPDAASPRVGHILSESPEFRDSITSAIEAHVAASRLAGDTLGEVLASVLSTRDDAFEADLPTARHYARIASRLGAARGEPVFSVPATVILAITGLRLRLSDVFEHLDTAWQGCQTTTDPDLRAAVVSVVVPLLHSTPDPRVPRMLAETLDFADRYPDEESAWVRPRMIKLAEDALAEARRQLHRARSQRDEAMVKRWKVAERKLRDIAGS